MDVALKGLHPCKRETVRGAGRGSTRIPSSHACQARKENPNQLCLNLKKSMQMVYLLMFQVIGIFCRRNIEQMWKSHTYIYIYIIYSAGKCLKPPSQKGQTQAN